MNNLTEIRPADHLQGEQTGIVMKREDMLMMVMTILEARVATENWEALLRAYQAGTAAQRPPQLTQTFLTQSAADHSIWRIISFWNNREGLEEMRRTAGTPAGVLMFRAAGAEPALSVYDVVDSLAAQS